ncbi:centrosomal protein of 85 kDa isoform X1 [Alosa pseudoharengus]|uniref:centrosomal protein of 85 kDa isoform X1 n=2 Tax=Alosa pseudoharengus TaxID=34774 RepID=UPI003F892E0B
MTTSQRHQDTKVSVGYKDMEWQTPAVSEKFQRRFGWRPSTADSGDTGFGATPSDNSEDLCSSSSSSSFQPIRSQIPIPTAHVMPSTAGTPASKPQPRSLPKEEPQVSSSSTSRNSSSTSSSKSSLSKSASSPNLDAQGASGLDAGAGGPKPDCLSRYRSLVNGLDHSLFPGGEYTRLDDPQHFDMPNMEPTLNQSMLMGGLGGADVLRPPVTGFRDGDAYRPSLEQSYRVLPEAQSGLASGSVDPYGMRGGGLGVGHPLGLQMGAKVYEPLLQERCAELNNWKQLENLRLQVEQMQLYTTGSCQYPPLYQSAALHSDGNKWEALIKTNENLLKEKDMLIERQKQQVAQLEQRLRDSELQVHSALLGRGAPYPDVCLLRLQEAQRENAFLRAQFAERSDGLAKEKAEAERHLGAVEAETRRLTESLREGAEKHAEELKRQEERIRNRDKHINNLKKKCQKETEQSRERQQRIETLERYLADLPTMEDYQAQSKQLEEAERRTEQLQATVEELEARLGESRSATRDRDAQLEEQRRRERELLSTVTSLQERVQEGLEDGARLPSLDLEKLRTENTALREEQHRLKKVIEKQLRMMEQLGTQIRTLEDQVSLEESSSQALREELMGKEQGLLQLRSAMKELSSQNQDLLDQNLTLQEHLEEADRAGFGSGVGHGRGPPQAASARLTQRLHGEMAACLCDLRSLCSVLTQRTQGQDPNLSMLLGIGSPPPLADPCEDWLSSEVLQRKLAEAQQLRRDVEQLRTTISDRYAQDMGENCITQ